MSSFPNHIPPASENESDSSEVIGPLPAPADDISAVPAQSGWETASSATPEPSSEEAGEPIQTTFLEPQSSKPPESVPSEPLFEWYNRPQVILPARIPNVGDLGLLALLLFLGWVGSGALLAIALHFHLWGITTVKQALGDVRYTLGSQAVWYVISFGSALLLFPAVWHKGFLAALQWRGALAFRMRWRLVSATLVCFGLAVVDGIVLPGPPDTPIDVIFRMPGAAWFLFGFGITLAPLFEEIAFRGFLLPAACTAYDWTNERFSETLPRRPDENGHPRWSLRAMAFGSIVTSIPFALMHAEQTSYSVGPFLLLICVSLALCWVRLSTRSLAASVLVHSCYNFLLFSLMLLGTGGFKHLDKF